MKRFLLGGTALAAATVIAGGAKAAEGGMKLGVDEHLDSADGFASESNGPDDARYQHKSDTLDRDDEIHFKGETKLDNGLTLGAQVELEGTSFGRIDERWIYFRGGWGELRLGDEDDARKLKSYAAPTPPANTFGVNSAFLTFNNLGPGQVVTTVSTFRNASNDSAKLIYFTPRFGGFQIAVSYAPGGQDRAGFGTANANNCPQIEDAISVGADYSGSFGGVTIGGGGGYTEGQPKCNGVDEGNSPHVWTVGLNVGFAGFAVGGSIMFGDKILSDPTSGRGVDNDTEFDLGATYVLDALVVDIGWDHGKYDRGGLGADTLDQARVGASYALGPGISVDAMVGYFDYSCDSCNDNKGWQTGIGIAIVF